MQMLGTAGQAFISRYGNRYTADANGLATINGPDIPDALQAGFVQQTARNNLSATTDPGIGNDNTQGYQPGSLWINLTAAPDRTWRCTDASTGAAVWVSDSDENSAQFNNSALSGATATAGLLTPATPGVAEVVARMTANGANALTTRTAAQMFADVPGAQAGLSYALRVISAGDNTVTLTAGNGVTITGTATIATGTYRDFIVTLTSPTAVAIQAVGSGTA